MDRIKVERAIDGLVEWQKHVQTNSDIDRDISTAIEALKAQLSQQGTTKGTTSDMISKFIDGLEKTFAYIREREGGDSVCGLCEYDGAYIGESGDWCNECPGFNRDDCFKLSDKTRKEWTEEIVKALPTIQPEKAQLFKQGVTSDMISKTEVVKHLRRMLEATVPNTDYDEGFIDGVEFGISTASTMPTIQSESSIPLSWIDEQIERLKGMDNAFATLTAMQISVMLKKWRDEQNEVD